MDGPQRLVFRVQGSEPEPYLCEFVRDGDRLLARCSCAAGQNGQACKHRLGLLAGESAGVVEGAEHLAGLAAMLDQSMLQQALAELLAAERALDAAKANAARAKRKLARVMEG